MKSSVHSFLSLRPQWYQSPKGLPDYPIGCWPVLSKSIILCTTNSNSCLLQKRLFLTKPFATCSFHLWSLDFECTYNSYSITQSVIIPEFYFCFPQVSINFYNQQWWDFKKLMEIMKNKFTLVQKNLKSIFKSSWKTHIMENYAWL